MGKWKGSKKTQEFNRRKNASGEKIVAGSFSLESIKESVAWGNRVEYQNTPKRNWALCFGYIGSNYQGLQINPDCNSVERHLEKALLLAGGIQETNFGNLNRIHWNRAARTDKGVHANAQCIAAKLSVHKGDEGSEEEKSSARRVFVDKVNEFLPSDIHLHHITKVTKKFNAKNFCGSRTYHYLIPSYTCLPKESLVACLEKVEGNINKLKGLDSINAYQINEERKSELEKVLKCFVGTFKFHNFTSGKTSSDGDASRYIKKFTIANTFKDENSGVEWLVLEVHGQSFLYNQIRKMVGAALQVINGALSVEDLRANFLETDARNPSIPIAPGLGLYLHEMEYDGYNKKVGMLNTSGDSRMLKTTSVTAAADSGQGSIVEAPALKKQRTVDFEGDSVSVVAASGEGDHQNGQTDNDRTEEESVCERELLDLSCSEDMVEFQCKIRQHIMAEEEREGIFLAYVATTTTIKVEKGVRDEKK